MSLFFNGDLVTNGSFEAGLLGWTATNVGLGNMDTAHEGLASAAMGQADNTVIATLSQIVPVQASRFYKLYFHVSGQIDAPADLSVMIEWLDFNNNFISLGFPSNLFVPGNTVGASNVGEWKSIAAITTAAPFNAAFARITFTKQPGPAGNWLVLDDVVFAAQ